MSGQDLERLRADLDRLEGTPVDGHPAVLDDVHRALVGELDGLARTAESSTQAPASRGA